MYGRLTVRCKASSPTTICPPPLQHPHSGYAIKLEFKMKVEKRMQRLRSQESIRLPMPAMPQPASPPLVPLKARELTGPRRSSPTALRRRYHHSQCERSRRCVDESLQSLEISASWRCVVRGLEPGRLQ